MAVKAISEFAIQPGRRDEFVRLFESLMAQHFGVSRHRCGGGSSRFERLSRSFGA